VPRRVVLHRLCRVPDARVLLPVVESLGADCAACRSSHEVTPRMEPAGSAPSPASRYAVFLPFVDATLFPAIEFDLVWPGATFPCFEKRFEAEQEDRPLRAAMVHELHWLLPVCVLEKEDGPIVILFDVEAYFCPEPLFRSVNHPPENAPGWLKLEDLHIETTGTKAELDDTADLAVAPRVTGPPPGQTFNCGQCLIDIIW
jgi:hypothetical protein